jgi:hypothetical protein
LIRGTTYGFSHVKLLSRERVILNNLPVCKENGKNNHSYSWLGIGLAVYILFTYLINTDHLSIATHTINVVYAQQGQLPSSAPSTPFLEWYETQKDNLQSANPIAVKILSPAKNESVPAGQELVVSGTSTDNATSDCKVSVIVNGVRPYQETVANGTGGTDDYSTWNFIINPAYTTIKEGSGNKITSKLECSPSLTKWYSVNVTGIGSTITDPNRAAIPVPGGETSGPSLSISVNIDPNPPTFEDDQTIQAIVLDAVSHLQVNTAILELEITDPLGNSAVISDEDGDILYNIGEESEEEEEGENSLTDMPGTFTVNLHASAPGYDPESMTTTFNLIEQGDEDEESESDEDIDDDDDSESVGELFE